VIQVLPQTIRRQFLTRLRAPASPAERHNVERVLAAARIFLAVSSWLAINLDPTQPTRYETLAHVLMSLYVLHSIGVWATLRMRPGVGRVFPWVLQGIDLLWPAVITWFTEGASSPFYPFFFFALMTAAFRWAFLETVATALIADVLLCVQAVLSTYGGIHLHPLLAAPVEMNTFLPRITYLFIVALLLGYLAQKEKELRAQTTVTARLIEETRLRGGVRGALASLMGELLRLFQGRYAVLALEETGTQRVYVWEARPAPNGGEVVLELKEEAFSARPAWFPPSPAAAFYAERRKPTRASWRITALDQNGRALRDLSGIDPQVYPGAERARSLIVLAVALGHEWRGRLLLYDVHPGLNRGAELRFAQALLQRIAPTAYAVYLLHQLRTRAGAIERARVARELHDGAIQSLIGAEMRVDVLRRHADGSPNAAELAEIQHVLRNEVLNLRELMQQMKPVELDPHQLLDYLADLVDRFRRDTGISARFVSDLQEADIPRRIGRELARILQEALVNVRKHSGAQHVLVHFRSEEGHWRLIVEDDGRGFDFAGRLAQAELESPRRGPAIIKERVRALGGELAIESKPGHGARLEVSIPHKTGYNLRVELLP
jgi:signal transduction histidine kinase